LSQTRIPPPRKGWLEENQLLAQVKAGKADAIRSLSMEQGARLTRLAWLLAGQGEDTSPLLRRAFVQALRLSAARQEEEGLDIWLAGTLIREWHLRSPPSIPPAPESRKGQGRKPAPKPTAGRPGPRVTKAGPAFTARGGHAAPVIDWSAEAALPEARAALRAALLEAGRRLAPLERVAWVSGDVMAGGPELTADLIDLTPQGAASLLHRARLRLITALAEQRPPGATAPGPPPERRETGDGRCPEVVARLGAWLAGEMDDGPEGIGTHLESCGDCAALARLYRTVVDLALELELPDAPEGISGLIEAAAAEARESGAPSPTYVHQEDSEGNPPGGGKPAGDEAGAAKPKPAGGI
jgi:DNA-directed RNA polymerase specialized sigma24 family protein